MDSPPSSPRTVQLAAAILEHTTSIETYLQDNGLPSPSLAPGTPPKLLLPPALEQSLHAALSALDELNALLLGPMGWLLNQVGHMYDLVSLHALYRYKVPGLFPVGQEVSIAEVSKRSGANEDAMSRILQHAVTNYLLDQPRPGYIAHSACSAMLAQSPALNDFIGNACEDMWPAAPHVVPALAKWPGPPLPTQTGHNLAERTQLPFFATIEEDPARAGRFARSMGMMQSMPGFEPSAALKGYDWGALGQGATVVDVGGADGAFAVMLTDMHPTLRVVLQDTPRVIEHTHSTLPPRSTNAVTLMEHDFFSPQPVHSADAYFFRKILHDWPDDYCLRILRHLIPALKPGARIIINDNCIPPPGVISKFQERQVRCQDLAMMAVFNSKERSMEEWTQLVTKADPRFRLKSVVQLPPSSLAMLEVVWESQ